MAQFTVDDNGSMSWLWDGMWYQMTYQDSRYLDTLYKGGHPHGPTHAEKLELIEKHGWEKCPHNTKVMFVRRPR